MQFRETNDANLALLAPFLRSLKPEQFAIQQFRMFNKSLASPVQTGKTYKAETAFQSLDDCGSIGCAVGWGPFVEGLEAIPSDFQCGSLVFTAYSLRVFGLDHNEALWEFLFSSDWRYIDNTAEGAATRIEFYLAGELGDMDDFQFTGDDVESLCDWKREYNMWRDNTEVGYESA